MPKFSRRKSSHKVKKSKVRSRKVRRSKVRRNTPMTSLRKKKHRKSKSKSKSKKRKMKGGDMVSKEFTLEACTPSKIKLKSKLCSSGIYKYGPYLYIPEEQSFDFNLILNLIYDKYNKKQKTKEEETDKQLSEAHFLYIKIDFTIPRSNLKDFNICKIQYIMERQKRTGLIHKKDMDKYSPDVTLSAQPKSIQLTTKSKEYYVYYNHNIKIENIKVKKKNGEIEDVKKLTVSEGSDITELGIKHFNS